MKPNDIKQKKLTLSMKCELFCYQTAINAQVKKCALQKKSAFNESNYSDISKMSV